MTGTHPDIGPELRALAQTILDRLDPALRTAAAMATRGGDTPGPCQQVWCPVCALAALASGEQHPLLTVVAEHSAALLTVIRGLVEQDGPPPDGPPPDQPPPAGPGRYEHIPVTVTQ